MVQNFKFHKFNGEMKNLQHAIFSPSDWTALYESHVSLNY